MAMFFGVPRVATQPLRVRRHFEWVSRMLATTMGAVMDPRESELVPELTICESVSAETPLLIDDFAEVCKALWRRRHKPDYSHRRAD